MAGRLHAAVHDRRMPLESFEECSRWCNTARSFARFLPIAEALAQALFGRELPRLVSKNGLGVADYTEGIDALKEQWGEIEAEDEDVQRNPDADLTAEPRI
jgi:hypothetical protein